MKTNIFIDKSNQELIVRYRKAAIFFEGKADITKLNSYGERHSDYICIKELRKLYNFSEDEFLRFIKHCNTIADEVWINFEPKLAVSWGSDYDDYYDSEFDNNGSLSIRYGILSIQGPYTQLKSSGEIIRLIKFNKRKFESFIYDLNKHLSCEK